jgi:hypothetical protein
MHAQLRQCLLTQALSLTIPNPISLTLRVVLVRRHMGLGTRFELGRLLQFEVILSLLALLHEGLQRPLGTAVQPCGINYVTEGHGDTHKLSLVVRLLGDSAWGCVMDLCYFLFFGQRGILDLRCNIWSLYYRDLIGYYSDLGIIVISLSSFLVRRTHIVTAPPPTLRFVFPAI